MKFQKIIILLLIAGCGPVNNTLRQEEESQRTVKDSLQFPPWLAKLYPEELRTEGHTLFQKLVSFTTLNESISYCVYKQNDGIC
ncbi:MAG: hypothetical protein AB1458_05095, partial [Bacteroidota bacterium]